MGLFRSKKVTTVGTSISRVIKDAQVPDSVRAGMITALYKDEDLVDHILEGALSSLGTRLEQMYRYGEREGTYGMPSGEIVSATQGGPELQAVLDALEGQPVLMEYRYFGPPNLYHMAWKVLIEQHGYDPETNRLGNLSAQLNKEIYLDDLIPELPLSELDNHDPKEIQLWEKSPASGYTPERKLVVDQYADKYYPPTPPLFSQSVTQARVRVNYVYATRVGRGINRDTEYIKGSFIVDPLFTGGPDDDDYFHVKYSVNGQVKYWMYKYESGIYPTLDAAYLSSPVQIGDFYPNIYMRLDMQKINKTNKPNAYRTQKRMAKYLGFDYDLIMESVHENEDIDDVEQAFINFGVNADTTEQLDLQYLYAFFDNLYQTQESQPETSTPTLTITERLSRRRVGIGIQRAVTIKDAAFKYELIHEGITKIRVAGTIGEVGHVSFQNSFLTFQTVREDRNGVESLVPRQFPCRFYRKQIAPGFYDEVRAVNVVMKYYIKGKYYTILGDQSKEILLVPLDRTLIKQFMVRDREKIIARSIHFVANSRVVQKVRWYEQSWFADLIAIIGIILTIITLGGDGGFFAAAGAAIAAGTYLYLIYLIAIQVIIYVAVQEAVKLFVKLVGPELAFLAALVAAAYGVTVGFEGAAASAVSTTLLTAPNLLMLSSTLASGVAANVQEEMEDLMKDATRFGEYVKRQTKLLEEGASLLENRSLLSPITVLGESPKHYYKRTVHSGNIGTLIYQDLHNYVGRSLQLPDFSTSTGGARYEF